MSSSPSTTTVPPTPRSDGEILQSANVKSLRASSPPLPRRGLATPQLGLSSSHRHPRDVSLTVAAAASPDVEKEPFQRFDAAVIWLQEFRRFKNKANVFNHTGVSKELAEMIQRWHTPGQLLAVGKPEHIEIIEAKLKIRCLYNEAVLEVMWA